MANDNNNNENATNSTTTATSSGNGVKKNNDSNDNGRQLTSSPNEAKEDTTTAPKAATSKQSAQHSSFVRADTTGDDNSINDAFKQTRGGYNDMEPLTYHKYTFHRSCKLHFELKRESMAVLRSMMIGGLNDEVNSFEDPPFSELSVSERQGFQLQRPILMEEVLRRAYFLHYVDQRDPKVIFRCTRSSFPKPNQWSLERCIEWLNHPMHQLATQDEFIWMRETYDAFRVVTAAKTTAQRQSRQAALAASQAAAHKLLLGENSNIFHGTAGGSVGALTTATLKRNYDPDHDDDAGYGSDRKRRKRNNNTNNNSSEDVALLQILQTSQNVLTSVTTAMGEIQKQTTRLTECLACQAQLAALTSRETQLAALVATRLATRDRREELQVTNPKFPHRLVQQAEKDYQESWKQLQAVQDEIKSLQESLLANNLTSPEDSIPKEV